MQEREFGKAKGSNPTTHLAMFPLRIFPNAPPRRLIALLAVLLAVTLAAYLPALDNGFVWDDEQYIVDNPHVAGGLSRESARWALTAFAAGNWHPLTWMSHMLDVELFGLAPRGHHLVNILFHLANVALVFTLFYRLTGAHGRSLAVAALFALHPLRVESVAWAAERKDVLSTLLGLLAIQVHVGRARRPRLHRNLALTLLFALGLAAKPMLVTLPFALLLLDFWPLGRLRAGTLRPLVIEKLPLFALSAASSIVTWSAQQGFGAVAIYGWEERVSNAAVSYVRYLAMTIAPFDLAAIYPLPLQAWPLWQTTGALLTLASLSALALARSRRWPWLPVGWFWYVGTLVPVIGIVHVGQQAVADRYTYVPAVGLFVILAWGCGEFAARRPAASPYLVVLAGVALCALPVLTARQVGVWKDPVALFEHAARVVPGNRVAHYNLGVHLQKLGRDDEAIGHYREVLRSVPGHAKALTNLGVLLSAKGLSNDAELSFLAALRSAPDHKEALNNLGREYMSQGRHPEAEAAFLKALRLAREDLEPRVNLGMLKLKTRQWREAETAFAEAARVHRASVEARNGLGVALARQGRYAEAAAAFEEALRLRPGDRDLGGNLQRALQLARPAADPENVR